MADPKLEQLKRVPIFSQCSKSELQALARNTDDVSLPAGRTLIEQGHPNHSFYILIEGEAEALVDGQSVRQMRAGDVFGEISMLDRGPATATVVTTTPVEALVMSHAQFRDAVRSDENIAHSVISVMAERLRQDTHAHPAA
jgi:CRP-like cAMP-binding protein